MNSSISREMVTQMTCMSISSRLTELPVVQQWFCGIPLNDEHTHQSFRDLGLNKETNFFAISVINRWSSVLPQATVSNFLFNWNGNDKLYTDLKGKICIKDKNYWQRCYIHAKQFESGTFYILQNCMPVISEYHQEVFVIYSCLQ